MNTKNLERSKELRGHDVLISCRVKGKKIRVYDGELRIIGNRHIIVRKESGCIFKFSTKKIVSIELVSELNRPDVSPSDTSVEEVEA